MALRLVLLALLSLVPPADGLDNARAKFIEQAAGAAPVATERLLVSTMESTGACGLGLPHILVYLQGSERTVDVCFNDVAHVLWLKQLLFWGEYTTVLPQRQHILRAHAEELMDGQKLSELSQRSDGSYEPLWMTSKVLVTVCIRDSLRSDVKGFLQFDVYADTTTILAVKEAVLPHVGLADVGSGPREILVGRVRLFRDENGHTSEELEDSKVLAHYGAGYTGEELLHCVIDQQLRRTESYPWSTGDSTIGCWSWRPHIRVYLQDVESAVDVCFSGDDNVFWLKQLLLWGEYTTVLPQRQHILRAHEEELMDEQKLSELSQRSDGSYEPLWMTSKVRVTVCIRDSLGSDVKGFLQFDVYADTTTILAVKEAVLHHVGLADVGSGPREILVGRLRLFRDEDSDTSAELEDSQVLAHYGAGYTGYEELLHCVINQPLRIERDQNGA